MSTLFETDVQSAGWHLNTLEIYNWGTFHDKIYRLAPRGKNSLLTGANGSGKTTVVDALVTLLVPPGKRHYNQSSGADKKRERDETSYVLGAYGTLRDEDSTTGETQYLRGKDDFSLLLASFANESFQQEATLAQLRWWSAGTLKRLYLVANAGLCSEDLLPFDGGPAWKKALTARHPVKFFDTFALYGQTFSSLFGLKSDKALSLFSHVVGVKVLGDLNEFIRDNMLDAADMEEDFAKLKKNYEDLLGAHQQIEKAREQLRLLEPAMLAGERWETLSQQKAEQDQAWDAVAPVFAAQEKRLLAEAKNREQVRLAAVEAQKDSLELQLEDLRRQERDWEFALRDKSQSGLLDALERDVAHRRDILAGKERLRHEYDSLAKALGFGPVQGEPGFWEHREEAVRQKSALEEQVAPASVAWAEGRNRLLAASEEAEALSQELESLRHHSDAIPRDRRQWRDRMAADLDMDPEKLPFAAALVRVLDPAWRPAVERLLGDVLLAVIVDPEHESAIRTWVDEHPGKILVLRDSAEEQFFVSEERDQLSDLLEFRRLAPWGERLAAWLRRTYDFQACERDQLSRTQRGFTQDGWIRDGRLWSRPSPGWEDPGCFVLGWENEVQRKALFQRRETAQAELTRLEAQQSALEDKRRQTDNRRILLEKLLDFTAWNQLDTETETAELAKLAERKKALTGDSGTDQLHQRLAELKVALKDKTREKDETTAQSGRLRKTLEEYEMEESAAQRILLDFAGFDLEEGHRRLEPWLKQVNILLDLGSLVKVRDEVSRTLAGERKRTIDELKMVERELETALHRYINPGAELAARFPEWTGETASLMAKADNLDEFRQRYDRIRREDLPGYQKRFKDWLNQRLLEDIADFRTSLENHLRAIQETVRELNSSLKTITYNSLPATFIQLQAEDSRDLQIRDFRRMLKEALAGDSDLEQAFHRIRAIIQALSDDELWRKKVTDVRHWLQFAAVERYAEDGSQRQYYQDSQSLSGGEKAKLAYTILASAIAHQFGIRGTAGSRSLRFAVVDEAFSKVDPENSKFAMKLFEQMNLQLMVVTPLDKINVVEDYICTIHYVENKNRKTSAVYDLSLEKSEDFHDVRPRPPYSR
ncbi:MAG: hypothetical protein HKM05_02255 [Spirochaetales bacterium]|nr:hypothetical protein [Spirochaetales bacterium]